MTQQYRRKPDIVSAVRWSGRESYDAAAAFLAGVDALFHNPLDSGGFITVPTAGGVTQCRAGDWLVSDGKGKVWVVEGEAFPELYDPVDPAVDDAMRRLREEEKP